jgi:hypothetical protein
MATYYISPTGDDSTGAGSAVSPWKTISKAHTSASNGDTIYCQAGTHTWLAQVFTKALTIQGASPLTTIFDAGGNSAAVQWRTSPAMIVNDLTFQNNGTTSHIYGLFEGSTTALATWSFTRCIFHDLSAYASSAAYGSSLFTNTANGDNSGGAGYTFTACLFYDINSSSAGGTIFGAGSNAGTYSSASYYTLTNCTIYLDTSGATALTSFLRLGRATQTATFTNCAIKSVQSLALSSATHAGTVTATYSAFNGISSPPTGTGVITSDPLFVDAANANFRLRPTSPCIATGTVV